MTLRWVDSCSYYNDDDIPYKVENSFDQSDIEGPYSTGEQQYARQVNHTFSGGELWNFSSGEIVTDEVVYGFEIYNTLNATQSNGHLFYRGSGVQFDFRFREDGTISIYRGEMNTWLAQTQPGVITPRTWHYVEIKVKIANSGWWELRVDGKVVSKGTGDTQYQGSSGTDRIYHRGRSDASLIRNNYVLDSAGSYNNDFLGPVWIRAEPPVTSGEHQDWLPSGESTNLACVDDTGDSPPDIDIATYLGSVTNGAIDTYKFNLDESIVPDMDILAVAVSYCGDHNNVPVHPDGQGSNSAVVFHTESEFQKSGEYGTSPWINKTAYAMWQGIWDRNPSGEIEWTKSDIEAGEFGIQMNTGQPP